MENEIKGYIHCRICWGDRPEGETPANWQDVSVGFTEKGIQVWCNRCDEEVIHATATDKDMVLQ